MNFQLSLLRISQLIVIVIMMDACKPNNVEFELAPVQLRLSADTVYFDTLLSTVTSTTKRLRIFNDDAKAVTISTIDISNSSDAFSIIVNGIEGNSFRNTDLLAGDSLLILLKANLQDQNQNLPFVVEESLTLSTNGVAQNIPVIAWGQDAHFLRDSVLVCNSVWKAGKPYVIYDNVLIDTLCNLTIEPGTRIFSHIGSTIFVKGTIKAQGNAVSPILFTNDRFDNGFDNAPGQWGGIVFIEGSKDNELSFTHIRNAQNGIWLGTPDDDDIPDLIMNSSIIENVSGAGILSFTSDLTLTNCLINNCVEFNFAGLAGGNYDFKHNTFANFGYGFFRSQPIMVFTNNLQLSDGSVIFADLKANLNNNIIWGSKTDEIQLAQSTENLFDIAFMDNLMRSSMSEFATDNIINKDPLFTQPSEYNYRIDSLSPAINVGADLAIKIDLDSLQRDDKPDIGAYEWRQN